ncbi:hypothetical protein BJ742DRAFT_899765 [Cladochytrium replicatum]|nr:hypothetical protein BJ742DRAFT_899765 [Cladochytrium replicatum]
MSMSANKIPQAVARRALLWCDNPQHLVLVCRAFQEAAASPELRAQWLLRHPIELNKWAKKIGEERTVTGAQFAEKRRDLLPYQFPEGLLSEETILMLLEYLHRTAGTDTTTTDEERKSTFAWPAESRNSGPDTLLRSVLIGLKGPMIRELVRALVSHSCLNVYLTSLEWVLTSGGPLIDYIDKVGWREVTYAGIVGIEVASITSRASRTSRSGSYFKTSGMMNNQSVAQKRQKSIDSSSIQLNAILAYLLRERISTLSDDVPDAVVFAASLGRTECVKIFTEKAKMNDSQMLARALQEAWSRGHWEISEYLVPKISNDTLKEQISKQYEDLRVISELGEIGNWEEVERTLESWRQSSEGGKPSTTKQSTFLVRWYHAIESACHRGEDEFVERLLQTSDAGRPNARMFALALAEGYHDVAAILLRYVPRSSSPDEWCADHLLSTLPVDEKHAYEVLFLRYSRFMDPQIALELAGDTSQPVTTSAGAIHRRDFIKFVIENELVDLRGKVAQEVIWASLIAGKTDILQLLRKAGTPFGWMEHANKIDTEANYSIEPAQLSDKHDAQIPASSGQMFVLSALGGDWAKVARASFQDSNGLESFLEKEIKLAISSKPLTRKPSTGGEIPAQRLAIKPRMLVDPNDNFWTALLSGDKDVISGFVDAKAELGWMEPIRAYRGIRSSSISESRSNSIFTEGSVEGLAYRPPENLFSEDLDPDEPVPKTWGEALGLDEAVNDNVDAQTLGMFVALGGHAPIPAAKC